MASVVSSVSGSATTAAVLGIGEAALDEVVKALLPEVSAVCWAWLDGRKDSGVFGYLESHFLEPIFAELFGPNPALVAPVAPVPNA